MYVKQTRSVWQPIVDLIHGLPAFGPVQHIVLSHVQNVHTADLYIHTSINRGLCNSACMHATCGYHDDATMVATVPGLYLRFGPPNLTSGLFTSKHANT